MRLFLNKHASEAISGIVGYAAGISTNYLLTKYGYWKKPDGEVIPSGATKQHIKGVTSQDGGITQTDDKGGTTDQAVKNAVAKNDISQQATRK